MVKDLTKKELTTYKHVIHALEKIFDINEPELKLIKEIAELKDKVKELNHVINQFVNNQNTNEYQNTIGVSEYDPSKGQY